PSSEHPNSLAGVRGAQLYFRGDLEGTKKLVVAGTETRGRQHYVVVPPSIHPSGVAYEGELPPVGDLPEIPDWLSEMGRTGGNGRTRVVGEVIKKGEQHDTLVSLAGTMRNRGMGEKEIAAALLIVNSERCEVPGPEENILKIAKSVSGLYEPA